MSPSSMSRAAVLLAYCLLSFVAAAAASNSTAAGRRVSSLQLARIRKHLDKINKQPVKSITCPDGEIIDCVPLHRQLALDHPLLKNHKIQTEPPTMPTASTSAASREVNVRWQAWHDYGRCPDGTVPVRRSTVGDVLRAKSLFHYGKKRTAARYAPLARPAGGNAAPPDIVSGNGHEHAIAYTTSPSPVYYGARATINVWEPAVEVATEFSLSQMWLLSGSFDGDDLNSIEAGWQVSPDLYGDSKPRLFTYWTSDAYQATGCYNALCPGFVQTSSTFAIGAAISPVSSFSGTQYDITLLVWKDPHAGNWWLSFGDGTLVGYWPAELFTHLSDHATMVEWGGEVVNVRAGGEHTTTQMGSGRFAGDGFGRASYFRNLEVVDGDNSLYAAGNISTLAENTNCYNIQSFHNDDWGTSFFYGGPGRNRLCS